VQEIADINFNQGIWNFNDAHSLYPGETEELKLVVNETRK
jgi:hypothetical protein